MSADTTVRSATETNLLRFTRALHGRSPETIAGPLFDEFGPDSLRVLQFVHAAVSVVRREKGLDDERWLKRAFWIGFGISSGLDLVAFTLWSVWS